MGLGVERFLANNFYSVLLKILETARGAVGALAGSHHVFFSKCTAYGYLTDFDGLTRFP